MMFEEKVKEFLEFLNNRIEDENSYEILIGFDKNTNEFLHHFDLDKEFMNQLSEVLESYMS